MLLLKYDPVFGREFSYLDDFRYTPDYRTRRPIEFYFNWPWKYRYWFTNRRFRRNLYKELRDNMPLKTRYNPVYGNEYYLADTRSIPDYRIHRSYNFYDFWPYVVRMTLRNRPFRRWLTSPTYFRQSLYSNESSLVKSSSSVSKSISRYSSY